MMLLAVLLSVVGLTLGDVSHISVPPNACLTITVASANVRDAPCGPTIIGSATQGQNYVYGGSRNWCSLSGTNYHFTEINFNGQSGWIAGTLLSITMSRSCGNAIFPSPEFRAMWIATVYNIDWPASSSSSSQQQQNEMADYISIAGNTMNFNAIVFQVRPVGDAMYASSLEPWSRYLTGTQGVAPSPLYDPLEYTIQQAHANGIEVHAWLNPYRANMSPNCVTGLASTNMARRWPEHAKVYGNYCWMDPGAEVIIDHLANVVEDIITRYDVDGIHFDDYFYPYPTSDPFPDDDTYNAYINAGGTLSRDDWRRDNVNRMIQRVNNLIQSHAPQVAFTVSPFGIYRPGHPDGMPSPIVGLDPYTALYADSKLWLQQGWLDILAPQLYWRIEPPAQSYPTLLEWWAGANTANKHVYAGIGLYRLEAAEGDWPLEEFEAQIDVSRNYYSAGSEGHIHFSAKYFRDNTKGIRDRLSLYAYPSKVPPPAMAWKQLAIPSKPYWIGIENQKLSWVDVGASGVRWWAVYQREGQEWRLLRMLPSRQTMLKGVSTGVYAITAVNGARQQSEPAIAFVLDPKAQG